MPKDKDLKRLVRARMRDDGVRYTEALAGFDKRNPDGPLHEPTAPVGLRRLVIDFVDAPFVAVADGPVSRFYEFPRYPDVGLYWNEGYEAVQRRFIADGLRGGWWRTWLADDPGHPKQTVAVHLLEFDGPDAPAGHVQATVERHVSERITLVAGDGAAGFVGSPDPSGIVEGWAWLAVSVYEACIVTTGPAPDVHERLQRLVLEQLALVGREVQP